MNNEVTNTNEITEVTNNNELYAQVQQAVYEELKSIIKGNIFVKVEERTDNKTVDNIYISINNFGIHWNDRIRLYDGTAKVMVENRDYVKTIVVQEYENYRKYVSKKFFVYELDT
jgi:hypothetical protein